MNKENNDDDIRRLKTILKDYTEMRFEIESLQKQIEEVKNNARISSIKYDAVRPGKSDSTTNVDNIYNQVELKQHEIAKLERVIRRKERMIKRIDNAMEILDKDEQWLIRVRFFKKFTIKQVCGLMDKSTGSVIKKTNKILKKISEFV